MTKPNGEMRELSPDELDIVSGGAAQIQGEPNHTQQPSNLDRKKSGLDNIQKTMDILHGMNPKV